MSAEMAALMLIALAVAPAIIACVVLCVRASTASRGLASSVAQLARASEYDSAIDATDPVPSATHDGRHVAHDRPYLIDPASGVNLHVCVVDGCNTRLRRKQ